MVWSQDDVKTVFCVWGDTAVACNILLCRTDWSIERRGENSIQTGLQLDYPTRDNWSTDPKSAPNWIGDVHWSVHIHRFRLVELTPIRSDRSIEPTKSQPYVGVGGVMFNLNHDKMLSTLNSKHHNFQIIAKTFSTPDSKYHYIYISIVIKIVDISFTH